jgi:hypothetical protein
MMSCTAGGSWHSTILAVMVIGMLSVKMQTAPSQRVVGEQEVSFASELVIAAVMVSQTV